MPPKKKNKQQRNAFYWYMQELMPQLRREGRVFPNGMQDVVGIALPRWKALPEDEKERFERIAKEEKKKKGGGAANADRANRLDNQGNLIASRKDEAEELQKRLTRESKIARSRWPDGDDIKTESFYLIAFEFLCKTEEEEHLPVEVGMVEITMQDGIVNTLHQFIDPGGVPLGYRYQCQSHSEDRHQIPIESFELASNNYRGLWIKMENFVNPSGEKKEFPPIYCFGSDVEAVESCMDWLHQHACVGYVNRLKPKLFILENMVVNLFARVGKAISQTQVIDMLTTTAFDYEKDSRCPYHEEREVKHCALGYCKRYSYSMFDSLSNPELYNFPLTAAHMPSESNVQSSLNITPGFAVPMKTSPSRGRGRGGEVAWRRGRNPQGGGRGQRFAGDSRDFASRDIRYQQTYSELAGRDASYDDDDVYDDDDEDRSVILGNAQYDGGRPVSQAPVAAWAGRGGGALIGDPASRGADSPAVGGGDQRAKYAGRAGPPPASHLPAPNKGWTDDADDDLEDDDVIPAQTLREPKTAPMVMSLQPRLPASSQPQTQVNARPVGRGTAPSWRPANAASSWQPQGQQQQQQQQQKSPGDRKPTLAEAVKQKQQGDWRPAQDENNDFVKPAEGRKMTLHEAARLKEQQEQEQPQAVWQQSVAGRGRGVFSQDQTPPRLQPAAPPTTNPWQRGPAPSVPQQHGLQSQPSQLQPQLQGYPAPPSPNRTAEVNLGRSSVSPVSPVRPQTGVGRGRGAWGSSTSAAAPGKSAPSAGLAQPPPGFGRGLSIQQDMARVSMDDVE